MNEEPGARLLDNGMLSYFFCRDGTPSLHESPERINSAGRVKACFKKVRLRRGKHPFPRVPLAGRIRTVRGALGSAKKAQIRRAGQSREMKQKLCTPAASALMQTPG